MALYREEGNQKASMYNRLLHTAFRTAYRLRAIYWRIFQPHVYGVRVIAENDAGEILLIRHSYGRGDLYMLPGGGIKRGETAERAACRELFEEVGCTARGAKLFGEYLDQSHGAKDHISVFVVHTADIPKADGKEIIEAGFHPPHQLPETLSPATKRRLDERQSGHIPCSKW